MSESFQRLNDCFLHIAASSAEIKTEVSTEAAVSGFLDDNCSRQRFVLLEPHSRETIRIKEICALIIFDRH